MNYKCLPASIELLNDNKAYVTISEGKFHQVKRMINMCNGEVTYLKRIKFGPLELDNSLKEGEYHIAVAGIIINSKNEILITKRAPHKELRTNVGIKWWFYFSRRN